MQRPFVPDPTPPPKPPPPKPPGGSLSGDPNDAVLDRWLEITGRGPRVSSEGFLGDPVALAAAETVSEPGRAVRILMDLLRQSAIIQWSCWSSTTRQKCSGLLAAGSTECGNGAIGSDRRQTNSPSRE